MQFFLEEEKVAIGYSAKFRAYFIELKDCNAGTQDIKYCPWCGRKFLEMLDKEYDKALSKALGIRPKDITLSHYTTSNIPPEFHTDKWWKKRGL